jgi:hypothetical protein
MLAKLQRTLIYSICLIRRLCWQRFAKLVIFEGGSYWQLTFAQHMCIWSLMASPILIAPLPTSKHTQPGLKGKPPSRLNASTGRVVGVPALCLQ